MFRSQLFDHLQGAVFPCLVLLLLLCLFASSSCLFGMWLRVVYVCVCVCVWFTCLWEVWFRIPQPNFPQTSTSGTHTHGQHTAAYQTNNLTTQTSTEVVTALSTEDGPLKMVKQLWSKLIGFNDVFYKYF